MSCQGITIDLAQGQNIAIELSNANVFTLEDLGWNQISGDQSTINLSAFNNDSGFISDYTVTNSDLVGLNISSLTNDSGYTTFTPTTLLIDYGFTDNSTNWDLAYSWGDHSTQGYLTSYTVTQGDVTQHQAALSITESQISDLGNYLTTETDPTVPAHVKNITTTEKDNWNTAFGWGDHTSEGYLKNVTTESVGDLSDVDISGVTDNSVLKYNSVSGNWEVGVDIDTTYTSSDFDHNQLTNYVANEHIDWTVNAGVKINEANLPALAITSVSSVVDDTARNALIVQEGDIAVVDSSAEAGGEPATYIYDGTNWVKLKSPTDAVSSVFGRTGPVIAQNGDYNFNQINGTIVTNQIGDNQVTYGKLSSGVQSSLDLADSALQSFTETDPTVPAHVKSITTTEKSNWDTAYSWGDHNVEGYLTEVTNSDLTGLNISELNNDSGYITTYNVTEQDVTQHQAALNITESQISDLGNYIEDAPSDGEQYVRQNGDWGQINVPSGSGEYDAENEDIFNVKTLTFNDEYDNGRIE